MAGGLRVQGAKIICGRFPLSPLNFTLFLLDSPKEGKRGASCTVKLRILHATHPKRVVAYFKSLYKWANLMGIRGWANQKACGPRFIVKTYSSHSYDRANCRLYRVTDNGEVKSRNSTMSPFSGIKPPVGLYYGVCCSFI